MLLLAAVGALVVANSPWAALYRTLFEQPGRVALGGFGSVVTPPLRFWIDDLAMTLFFLRVGLEIKREIVGGELRTLGRATLPIAAATGGMALPALIFAFINRADPVALRGWAIPMATDIAFSLGLLALLGRRVPASLKVFLTAVAVIDDLGAIVVIAVFYAGGVSLPMLACAAASTGVLVALNRVGVRRVAPYLAVGAVLWLFVLRSGLHPTLAGVVTALALPVDPRPGDGDGNAPGTPSSRLEHALGPWVVLLILPLFAFANAGVSWRGLTFASFAGGVPLGIALGLVVGKAAGVGGGAWVALRAGGAVRPSAASPRQFAGVAALCGIGFTMSLFIGGLAFEGDAARLAAVRLGVLGGSLISALAGAALLAGAAPGAGLSGPKRGARCRSAGGR